MRTTPEFNVSDAFDHRALPSMDFVDKHMFTELRVVSKSSSHGPLFYAIAAEFPTDICSGTDLSQVAGLHFDFYTQLDCISYRSTSCPAFSTQASVYRC